MKDPMYLLLLLSISFSSCFAQIKGEGDIVDRQLKTGDFKSVKLKGSFNMIVTQGERNVSATGHGNIIDRLETTVENGTLILKLEKGNYRDYKLTVNVAAPDLNMIALAGSGDVWINDFSTKDMDVILDGSGDIVSKGKLDLNNRLNVRLSGSGDIKLDLIADNIESEVDGSGDIRLKGKTSMLTTSVNGSGDFHGQELKSDNCVASVNGSGDVRVNVTTELTGKVNGSGDIKFKGDPKVNSNVRGSGSINSL